MLTTLLPMAILVRTSIEPADQYGHDRFDEVVQAVIAREGRPPEGLMVHLSHPSGDGFVTVDVWRSEDAFHSWWNGVMEPALAEVGLAAREQEIHPVWRYARP